MTACVIDTNVYSGFRIGEPGSVRALRIAHEIHLPLIVLAELLAGFVVGSRLQKNRHELAQFMQLAQFMHKLYDSNGGTRAMQSVSTENQHDSSRNAWIRGFGRVAARRSVRKPGHPVRHRASSPRRGHRGSSGRY